MCFNLCGWRYVRNLQYQMHVANTAVRVEQIAALGQLPNYHLFSIHLSLMQLPAERPARQRLHPEKGAAGGGPIHLQPSVPFHSAQPRQLQLRCRETLDATVYAMM